MANYKFFSSLSPTRL
uniref:Uncharacterized protein n=1 Tax=Rhizophora mucronata TaxID=61149 RepID=A0A2P2MSC0_RHIMU